MPEFPGLASGLPRACLGYIWCWNGARLFFLVRCLVLFEGQHLNVSGRPYFVSNDKTVRYKLLKKNIYIAVVHWKNLNFHTPWAILHPPISVAVAPKPGKQNSRERVARQ